MKKIILKFFIIFLIILIIDQIIKQFFLQGFRLNGEFFSLILTFNKGVAFSMLSSLGENLKFIQILLLIAVFCYLLKEKNFFISHWLAFGLFFGGGVSNILDRFLYGGVVDYVFWHKWFNFAVFNFADVMIDLAVVLILFKSFIKKEAK